MDLVCSARGDIFSRKGKKRRKNVLVKVRD
jgi:hypothetical protein